MGKKPAKRGPKPPQSYLNPSPEPPPDPLIEPSVLKIAQLLKAGTLTAEEMAKPIKTTWSARVPPQLRPFIESPTVPKLVEMVRQHPWLLWHPLVFRQVQHVRKIQVNLRALVEAWAQGVLRGAWTLKPPPKPKGRKVSPDDISFNLSLLSEYEEILGLLKKQPVRKRKGESDRQWADRLTRTIHDVWRQSTLSQELVSPEHEDENKARDLLDWLDEPITIKEMSLPSAAAQKWAVEACALAAEGPLRDRIAYHLLAYRWDLRANQVRWRIQAARKFDKTIK